MIADSELADAVGDRQHWQPDGNGAIYTPPGTTVTMRVRRVAQQTKREEFMVSVVRDGQALYSTPCHSAAEAVRVAERTRVT